MNLTELKEACAKASPEPWGATQRPSRQWHIHGAGGGAVCYTAAATWKKSAERHAANSAFIAMSRSAVPELIARLEKAEALLRQAIDPHSDPMSDVDAIVAHLDPDAATDGAGDQWQPIETAPKDGSGAHVLLCEGNWVFEGQLTEEGWYERNNDSTDYWGRERHPTHWQPLPAPPKAASAEGKGEP